MNEIFSLLTENRATVVKATASDGRNNSEYKKIVLRPVVLKGQESWQAERFKERKVFHLNLDESGFESFLRSLLAEYRQFDVCFTDKNVTFFLNNGKIAKRRQTASARIKKGESHDREKTFIIKEGEAVPALVDLGVFTSDFKVVKGMYDKYQQINRFVEIIDDKFRKAQVDEVTVLDFGCGKSYLTFIVYYYFVEIRGIRAKIIGYDLKEDVVKRCNEIAAKYGYANLTFVKSDVTKDVLYDKKIDVVISLHACDIATDYALAYAVNHNVRYIFSVPCCQHEVNLSIKKGKSDDGNSADFNLLLGHGLIKERFSALLTDSIRAQILSDCGYTVDVNEFVDFEHSPKNVMLRAELNKKTTNSHREELLALRDKYGFNQTLMRLIYKE